MAKNKDERTNRLGDLPDDAEQILRCLDELEWTQQRAADEIGISQPNFNAFIKGKRPLPRAASARLLEGIRRGYDAKRAAGAVSPLTFDQAAQMPLGEVLQGVTREIYSGSSGYLNLLLLADKSETPEEHEAATDAYVKAQVDADPRVKFAELKFRLGAAEAWIRRVEKERDELKLELLKACEELIETYQRIDVLEKEMAEERQQK